MKESRDLINQLANQVNNAKKWNLSRQCLNELVEAVSAYIDPTDDQTIIKRKVINYYECSVDLKALQLNDSSTIERYQKYIIKVIRGHFQNLPRNYELEDLVNECWLVIFRKGLTNYKYASKLTTYLYPLTIRKVLEVIRSLKSIEDRKETVSISTPIYPASSDTSNTIENSLETKEPGPEKSSECKEIGDIIYELLDEELKHYSNKTKLSPEETTELLLRIFILKDIDTTYAQQLGDTKDNLYLRRHRFKNKFQPLLEKLVKV